MPDLHSDVLAFRVRDSADAHPTHTVRAQGTGDAFSMSCTCLASRHGALLCIHMAAVLRADKGLVMYGSDNFEEVTRRAAGSQVVDPEIGYWQHYPEH